MNSVNLTDLIFATVIKRGDTILNTSIKGVASFEDVIRHISKALRGVAAGMVTVILRNSTQGWALCRALKITPRPVSPVPEPVQLTLF